MAGCGLRGIADKTVDQQTVNGKQQTQAADSKQKATAKPRTQAQNHYVNHQ